MSLVDRAFGLLQRSLTLAERVDRLAKVADNLSSELREHDRRLIRIETLIEFSRRGSPRLTDE